MKKDNFERLRKLEELTNILPDINPIRIKGEGYTQVDTETGFGFFFPLFNIDSVAVLRGTLSKGLKFKIHYHEEREWVIVYKGKLKFQMNESDEKIISEGEYVCIEPNTIHNAEALEDTETIAITIPASPGFPKKIRE